MQRSTKHLALVTVVIVAAAGIGYAAITSSAPNAPCAATAALSLPVAPGSAPPIGQGQAGPRGGQVPALTQFPSDPPTAAGPIKVVAAENFWGSLVSQLGGNQTSVLSIMSDPNADPHEYEANSSDAIAVASAQLVILNGVGYDQWAQQLVDAANVPDQIVLNVGELNGVAVTGGLVSGNPHMWYNPAYVNATVAAIFSDLVELQPTSQSVFHENYAALNTSLGALYGQASEIRLHFAGSEIASTESIAVYLANFTALTLVSPPAFMEAVAEGNDPPASTIVDFQCQLESGHVSVLLYNKQTASPICSQMTALAVENNVTVVGITETLQPPGTSFQGWMGAEYFDLGAALASHARGT